jgi:hypothetical protein
MVSEEALAWHVMLRLVDGRVLAGCVAERRVLARTVLEHGQHAGMLVFRAADTHLHAILVTSRQEAGRFAHAAEVSLRGRLRLPVGFAAGHLVAIRDQAHLLRAFHYVLRQETRHGLEADREHEASSLPDLLGLRLIGAHTIDRVRRHLPRVGRPELVAHLGVASLPEAERPDLARVAAAAAAGIGDLGDAGSDARAGRRAVAHALPGLSVSQISALVGAPARTVQRWRVEPPDTRLVRAVRLQLGLRATLGSGGSTSVRPDPIGLYDRVTVPPGASYSASAADPA